MGAERTPREPRDGCSTARQGWDRSMKRPDKTELLVIAAMAAVAILLA